MGRYLGEDERLGLEAQLRRRALGQAARQRARIILLWDEGMGLRAIARQVSLSYPQVREWIRRYREYGPDGLRDHDRSGRPAKLPHAICEELLDLVATPPAELGLPFSRWTVDRLYGYLQERGRIGPISQETLRRRLRQCQAAVRASAEDAPPPGNNTGEEPGFDAFGAVDEMGISPTRDRLPGSPPDGGP